MSKLKLKKTLSTLSAPALAEMLLDLYDYDKGNKEYLEYWLDPQPDKMLDKYKDSLHKLFFIGADKTRRKVSIPDAKQLVTNYLKLNNEPEAELDLRLTLLERFADWAEDRRFVLSYRTAINNYLDDTLKAMQLHSLEDRFDERYRRVKERIDERFEHAAGPYPYSSWRRRRY